METMKLELENNEDKYNYIVEFLKDIEIKDVTIKLFKYEDNSYGKKLIIEL